MTRETPVDQSLHTSLHLRRRETNGAISKNLEIKFFKNEDLELILGDWIGHQVVDR